MHVASNAHDRARDTKLYYTELRTKKLRKVTRAGVWHGVDGIGIPGCCGLGWLVRMRRA